MSKEVCRDGNSGKVESLNCNSIRHSSRNWGFKGMTLFPDYNIQELYFDFPSQNVFAFTFWLHPNPLSHADYMLVMEPSCCYGRFTVYLTYWDSSAQIFLTLKFSTGNSASVDLYQTLIIIGVGLGFDSQGSVTFLYQILLSQLTLNPCQSSWGRSLRSRPAHHPEEQVFQELNMTK